MGNAGFISSTVVLLIIGVVLKMWVPFGVLVIRVPY